MAAGKKGKYERKKQEKEHSTLFYFTISLLLVFAILLGVGMLAFLLQGQIASKKNADVLGETANVPQSTTVQSCNHNWQGNVQAGFVICSECNKVLLSDDIKAKKGVGITSVEKAKIYWSLSSNLTALDKNGKYLYSEDEAFSMVERDYGVTRDFLKNSIWNGHARKDYEKYYIDAWRNSGSSKQQSSSSSSGVFQTVSKEDDQFWYAVSAAKELVKGKLKSPSSAKFPWSAEQYTVTRNGNSYQVGGYADAQNSFGVAIRVVWNASFTMGDTSGTKYQITNAKVTLSEN